MPTALDTPAFADPLLAFESWGDALACVDASRQRLLHANAAMQALVPGPTDTDLATWCAPVPGLWEATQRPGHGVVRCGASGQYHLQRAPLPEGQCLLRLVDDRSQLRAFQRQLDDRESLVFTSRALSLGEMGSTLAHELNQPIGACANLLRGLRARISRRADTHQPPEELTALESAIEQVTYAAKIIARIREYTQARSIKRQPVDVGALLADSVHLLDWDAQRVGAELRLTLPTEPIWVHGDPVMLQQVVVNLLRNALDALRLQAPAQALVEVQAARLSGHVQVSISDNGMGLTREAEQGLFLPFASTKPNGMGIGLAICRSFIELHQGRLWFSPGQPQGCTFHFSLALENTP
jgi:two-component system, LuxR family, sensor kinase FixL